MSQGGSALGVLPQTPKKPSIGQELTAVIVVVRRTMKTASMVAVATDYSYVHEGLQGAALVWRAKSSVTSKGLVSNVDLWVEVLQLLDSAIAIYQWIKVLSHVRIPGLKRADELAEMGRKASSVNTGEGVQVQRIGIPIVVYSPNTHHLPPIDSLLVIRTVVALAPNVCDAGSASPSAPITIHTPDVVR